MKHCFESKSVFGLGKGPRRGMVLGLGASSLLLGACAQPPRSEEPAAPTPTGEESGVGANLGVDAASFEEPVPTATNSPQDEKSSRPSATVSKTLPESFECSGHTCYRFAQSREALVPLLLHHKAQLIAFGEAHAPVSFKGDSTVKRFTRDLLPTISDGASHLLLELLNPPKEGCQKEKAAVQKESNEVTKGQAATNQNEYLALGNEARPRGVVPDILWTSCEDLAFIASPEGGVVAMMETIAKLSSKSLKEQLSSTRKGRPLVLAYGGAHHNDVTPKSGLEGWTYGPDMLEYTKGSYLEIDLIVPELIRDTDSWRNMAWYDAYKALDHKEGAVLMKWGDRSYSLFFAPSAPSGAKKE